MLIFLLIFFLATACSHNETTILKKHKIKNKIITKKTQQKTNKHVKTRRNKRIVVTTKKTPQPQNVGVINHISLKKNIIDNIISYQLDIDFSKKNYLHVTKEKNLKDQLELVLRFSNTTASKKTKKPLDFRFFEDLPIVFLRVRENIYKQYTDIVITYKRPKPSILYIKEKKNITYI